MLQKSWPDFFSRNGSGSLFYSARLRYAEDRLFQQGLDRGIRIERTYAPYVETGMRPPATTYKAGDRLVVKQVTRMATGRRDRQPYEIVFDKDGSEIELELAAGSTEFLVV